MKKQAARTTNLKRRQDLSSGKCEQYSLDIANQTLKVPIWDFSYYHMFLPIEKQAEVNTEYLLHILNGKDKNILIPKSDFENLTMRSILLTDSTKIKLNSYGIPEPFDGIEVASEKINVVFVPLLAFDKNGHRAGYGKGFYDRFLTECPLETVKVGLSFFEVEVENFEDISATDIPLDFCVTPDKIYRFGVIQGD